MKQGYPPLATERESRGHKGVIITCRERLSLINGSDSWVFPPWYRKIRNALVFRINVNPTTHESKAYAIMWWDRKQPPLANCPSWLACTNVLKTAMHHQEAWSPACRKCTCVWGFPGPTGKHQEKWFLFKWTDGERRWGDRVWEAVIRWFGGRHMEWWLQHLKWTLIFCDIILMHKR